METKELLRLVEIISRLRGADGCPWDKKQDFRSLRPYLLEEVYELLEAVDHNNNKAIKEELGDVLFVVLLLCQIGEDHHHFSLESLCQEISEKMVVRHPKIFSNPDHQQQNMDSMSAWEDEKAKQRPHRSRLDGVPNNLPALLTAFRQGEKAASVGFDWPDYTGVLAKVEEEMAELHAAIEGKNQVEIMHELGDVLMSLASLGRHLNASPEEALREANQRFAKRFKMMEDIANKQQSKLMNMSSAELEQLWERAKAHLS